MRAQPALDLSPEEVFRRYRGFDGVAWPNGGRVGFDLEGGLASVDDRPAVEQYRGKLVQSQESDLLLISRGGVAAHNGYDRPGWAFVGIDVGFYESELSHFSAVLNEVIWGELKELRKFSARLNANLLIGDEADALDLVATHEALQRAGRDVEEGRIEAIVVHVPLEV
jgi:hypothetical protein